MEIDLVKSLETDEHFGVGNNGEIFDVAFGLYAEKELTAADGTVIPADGLIEIITLSLFAAAPPVVNPDAAAVTMVWSYVGELIFNMLILVGAVKMADRVVREMMGL